MGFMGKELWYNQPIIFNILFMAKKSEDKRGLIIGAGVLLGLGVGFFVMEFNALYFVGSIMVGLGLGMALSYFVK
jgi:hypothetical protein